MRYEKLLMIALWMTGGGLVLAAGTRPKAEDFDSMPATWEALQNLSGGQDYGWSVTNNLGSVGCAPGELGGAVSSSGISWFADDIAVGAIMLDPSTDTLSASGWCQFTATEGTVNIGWFNANTYGGADTVPDTFIGWRQLDGTTIAAALGYTGSSFVDGTNIAIANGTAFRWALTYTPTGGANGFGRITLSVGGSVSMLSLTRAMRDALASNKLNRFGIVTDNGAELQTSTVWLDDLIYTVASGFPTPPPGALTHIQTQFFNNDPADWHGVQNQPSTPYAARIDQAYGYNSNGGRGDSGGCIGGYFDKAIGISYYGYDYGTNPRHLTQKLHSEGWFKVPQAAGDTVHFGWTNKKVNCWRNINSLSIRLTNESNDHIIVFGECSTRTNKTSSYTASRFGVISTFIATSDWHHYKLDFDPGQTDDPGTVTITIGDCFVNGQYAAGDHTWTFNLRPGQKNDGADFDLFGMWNQKVTADINQGRMAVYLDDVINTVDDQNDPSTYSGSNWIGDFTDNPGFHGWTGNGNNITYNDYLVRPYHQFGWTGSYGNGPYKPLNPPVPSLFCMGGSIYCIAGNSTSAFQACYGGVVNDGATMLTHNDPMCATGKMRIDWFNTDAHTLFGWYNSATATDREQSLFPAQFLGVDMERSDPSGSAFMACYRTANDPGGIVRGPNEGSRKSSYTLSPYVYADSQWVDFYIGYEPAPAGANKTGRITVQIGDSGKRAILDLDPEATQRGFKFDRFGLLTKRAGGKGLAPYFDKLTYTIAPSPLRNAIRDAQWNQYY